MPSLKSCLIALLFALPLASTAARADSFTTGSYYSGNQNDFVHGEMNFSLNGTNYTGAAGNIAGSTGVIGGKNFTFTEVFCVDLLDNIYLNTTYNATYTNNGVVKGVAVNNANKIAWLMLNLAPKANTAAQNEALQAAIWSVEYSNFSLLANNDPAVVAAFQNDLSLLGNNTASTSSLEWVTVTNNDGSFAQAQVAMTPEPNSLMLLGTGALSMAAAFRRRLFGAGAQSIS